MKDQEYFSSIAEKYGVPFMKGDKVSSQVDEYGNTLFHLASLKNDVETMIELKERGADIDQQNIIGETPLHLACFNASQDAFSQLLIWGAQVDLVDVNDSTPLHVAAKKNEIGMVMDLMEKGEAQEVETINSRDVNGLTPLFAAYVSEAVGAMVTLIEMGNANLNIPDNYGATPLHFAAFKGDFETARILLQRKGYFDEKDKNSWQSEVPAKHGANVNIRNQFGQTPMDVVVQNISSTTSAKEVNDRLKIIQMLSGKGKDFGLDDLKQILETSMPCLSKNKYDKDLVMAHRNRIIGSFLGQKETTSPSNRLPRSPLSSSSVTSPFKGIAIEEEEILPPPPPPPSPAVNVVANSGTAMDGRKNQNEK